MNNKTILITGVAGFIGSNFAHWIINNKPHLRIIGIDDLSGGYKDNVPKEVVFINKDISKDDISSIFEIYKPNIVYHFSSYAAEGLSPFIRKYNYTVNLVATSNIINNCIEYNVKRLVFTSSMAVYGHGSGKVFSEEDMPNPIDPYGIAKYACEMDIRVAGEQHGLDWCIIRPHNVYGTRQNIWDKYRNVLGIWMYQYLNNQPMTIFGDGEQKRAFSYIEDIMEPLCNAGVREKASKQIINLGGIKEYSINEANQLLRDIIGGDVEYKEQRHEVKVAVPTWEASKYYLGFEHKTDLKEGLIKMWEWAQIQPNRDRMVWDKYEINKNLYKFWKV